MSYYNNSYDDDSLWNRSLHSKRRRAQMLRRRLIIGGIALVALILIIVLVAKVIGGHKGSDSSGKTNAAKVTAKPTQEPTPEPTPEITEEPAGSARWLRTDLDGSKPMVALTFDDGPNGAITKRIVDAAAGVDGRVTFFMVGNRIDQFPDTVKAVYEAGCEVASHTYDHDDLKKLKKDRIKAEVDKTNEKINPLIGCDTTMLRPPYGNVNDKVRSVVPVPMIYWSVDSEDWKSRNAKSILKRCKDIKDGDIVLFHDLYSTTADAVEELAPRLKEDGFTLVTIDELFYYKGINATAGKVYFSGN